MLCEYSRDITHAGLMAPRYYELMKLILGCDGLRPVQKLVLMKIAQHSDGDTGANAWPSYSTLARAGCCSRRYAMDVVKELVATGYLRKDIGGGRHRTNSYALVIDKVTAPMRSSSASGDGEPQFTKRVNPSSPFMADASPDGELQIAPGCSPVHQEGESQFTTMVTSNSPDLPSYLPSYLPSDRNASPAARATALPLFQDEPERTLAVVTEAVLEMLRKFNAKGFRLDDADLVLAMMAHCAGYTSRRDVVEHAIDSARSILAQREATVNDGPPH
jgi:hypothetical protein